MECVIDCIRSEQCSTIDGCFCEDSNYALKNSGRLSCNGKVCYTAYKETIESKKYIVATDKFVDNQIGVICIGYTVISVNHNLKRIAVVGVTAATQSSKGMSKISVSSCEVAFNLQNKTELKSLPIQYTLQGKQADFGFTKMNSKDSIPKNAIKFRHSFYLGRSSGGRIVGTINDTGIMVGAHVDIDDDSDEQNAIYPTFEIFVCNSSLHNNSLA